MKELLPHGKGMFLIMTVYYKPMTVYCKPIRDVSNHVSNHDSVLQAYKRVKELLPQGKGKHAMKELLMELRFILIVLTCVIF